MSDSIAIVPFQAEYASDFDRLNREWLDGNGLLEPLDETYLRDPQGTILDAGGEVFVAVDAGRVLGVAAALPHEPGVFELAKLSVAAEARGHGLGRRLIGAVRQFAVERGAHKLVLVSSTKLTAALRLYEALGFQHRPMPPDPDYATADVYMELEL